LNVPFLFLFARRLAAAKGWTCQSLSLRRTPKTKGGQIKTKNECHKCILGADYTD